jgi:uncharacterized protein with ParB-like and HNH nuclease domain
MSTEIEAKEVTVGKLFSSDFMFKIPIYQRPLTWEKDNFDQLFEDILDAINSEQKQYFLGSIILQKYEDDENKFDLVDGQQRISSLAILMAVIRDLTDISDLKNNITSYLYQKEDKYKKIPEEMRIAPWEDLKEMFKKYIYDSEGTKNFKNDFEHKIIKYNDTQDPRYHLHEAISCFNEKVKEKLQKPEDLESFVRYLLNNVYLVYIKTGAFASAFHLFNVLNTRGMPLNTSDILKSENIGEIKDESTRLQCAKIWRDIENNLGREELENVIAFIRTIQLKEKAKLSIYEEYRKEIFGKRHLNKGREFIDYVKEVSDIYVDKVLEGKFNLGERSEEKRKENEYKNIIDLLRRFVPFSDWIPPLIAFSRKFRRVEKYLFNFILKLEKKVIIEWVAGFSSTEKITSLNRIIKLMDIENDPQTIVDKLLLYKDEELAGRPSRILDFSNKNQVESDLKGILNDTQFYSIYGGKLAKYILLRIDMKYWDLENFPGYPGTITVEHILPQTPPKNSEWVKIFSEEERMEWTNKIGNLVLLSGCKNSKAQNYDFNKKKTVYFKGKSTPFRITCEIENKDKWTLEELKSRQQKLLNDAKEIFLNY